MSLNKNEFQSLRFNVICGSAEETRKIKMDACNAVIHFEI